MSEREWKKPCRARVVYIAKHLNEAILLDSLKKLFFKLNSCTTHCAECLRIVLIQVKKPGKAICSFG